MRTVDRNGLEILVRSECQQLFVTATVGRLAYMNGGIPAGVPVNLALTDHQVLFRLGTSRALPAIYARPRTFEPRG
jgi:nitroimidazol reductase NimA-like FMN-containing flavoprotein (pyridoxamine 5'-phosphate oxidase superfamily)